MIGRRVIVRSHHRGNRFFRVPARETPCQHAVLKRGESRAISPASSIASSRATAGVGCSVGILASLARTLRSLEAMLRFQFSEAAVIWRQSAAANSRRRQSDSRIFPRPIAQAILDGPIAGRAIWLASLKSSCAATTRGTVRHHVVVSRKLILAIGHAVRTCRTSFHSSSSKSHEVFRRVRAAEPEAKRGAAARANRSKPTASSLCFGLRGRLRPVRGDHERGDGLQLLSRNQSCPPLSASFFHVAALPSDPGPNCRFVNASPSFARSDRPSPLKPITLPVNDARSRRPADGARHRCLPVAAFRFLERAALLRPKRFPDGSSWWLVGERRDVVPSAARCEASAPGTTPFF